MIYFKCTVYVQAENTHQNVCVCVCVCVRARARLRLYMNITYLKRGTCTYVYLYNKYI